MILMAMILFTNNNNYICTKYQHAARVLQIFVLYYPPPPKKKTNRDTSAFGYCMRSNYCTMGYVRNSIT